MTDKDFEELLHVIEFPATDENPLVFLTSSLGMPLCAVELKRTFAEDQGIPCELMPTDGLFSTFYSFVSGLNRFLST